jgi:hypothetical protein
VSELNHLSLGQQLGELTQAIRDLTGRVKSLEEGMENAQGLFAMGKGTVIGLVLASALVLNGAADVIGKVWSALK